MSNLEVNKTVELKDNDLEKVNGGSFDWKEFGVKYLETLKNPVGTLTDEHKKLVYAIKDKDYVEVACIAISLLGKGDEIIKKIIIECK